MDQLTDRVHFAREYALKKHKEQLYGTHPYIFHLDMVYHIMKENEMNEDYQVAAYLHDLLEDTDTSKNELEKIFGKHIAELVDAVSGFGNNRKEKLHLVIDKMSKYPKSINLKIADRLANSLCSKKDHLSLFKTYQKEQVELQHLFVYGNETLLKKLNTILNIQEIQKKSIPLP